MRKPQPQRSVTVGLEGVEIVTIETNCLSSRGISKAETETIHWAIDNLRSFIGEGPVPCQPTGGDAFNGMVKGAPLPWEFGTGRDRWSIVDANGDSVCCFDGSAPESKMLMAAVIVAVNTCGGLRAEVSDSASVREGDGA